MALVYESVHGCSAQSTSTALPIGAACMPVTGRANTLTLTVSTSDSGTASLSVALNTN